MPVSVTLKTIFVGLLVCACSNPKGSSDVRHFWRKNTVLLLCFIQQTPYLIHRPDACARPCVPTNSYGFSRKVKYGLFWVQQDWHLGNSLCPSLLSDCIGMCHRWWLLLGHTCSPMRGYCRVSVETFPRHQEKLAGSVPWSGAALQGLRGFLLNVCQHPSFTALPCWNVTRMPLRREEL